MEDYNLLVCIRDIFRIADVTCITVFSRPIHGKSLRPTAALWLRHAEQSCRNHF